MQLPSWDNFEKLCISVISGAIIMVVKIPLFKLKDWLLKKYKEARMKGSAEIKEILAESHQFMLGQFGDLKTEFSKTNDQVSLLMSMKVADDFANEDAGIFQTDVKGRFTNVNPKFCRISGRTTDELLGSGWVNMIHEPERSLTIRAWNYAVQEERNIETSVTVHHQENGLVKIHIRAYKMTSPEGKFIGFRGRIMETKIDDK